MLRETLAFVLLLGMLGLAGLGPALTLVAAARRPLLSAAALAPALGLALLHLIGFPLYRYVGPVAAWSIPALALLLLLSAALFLLYGRRHRSLAFRPSLRAIWPALAGLALLLLVLAAPLALRGIEYTAFRSNPSDAFLYMSFAQSARDVSWQTLAAGSDLVPGNLANVTRLAGESPTSLLTARFLGRPMAINHMVSMAALADVARLATHRFYYVYHLLCLAATAPALMAIAYRLRLRRSLLVLAALAGVLGFWARLVLEMDAGFELSALPLVALLVYGLVQAEEGAAPRWRAAALMAIPAAAAITVYPPALIAVLGAGLFLLLYHLRRGPAGRRHLLGYAAAGALALLLLLATGQLDYHWRGTLAITGVVEIQRNFRPLATRYLSTDFLAALAGFPIHVLVPDLPRVARIPLWAAFNGLGAALLLLALAGFWRPRGRLAGGRRTLLFLAVAAPILYALLAALQNPRSADKVLTYSYPYLILAVALGLTLLDGRLRPSWRPAARALVTGWLALSVLLGAFLPFLPRPHDTFARSQGLKDGDTYDLGAIRQALSTSPPELLLVNTPAVGDNWYYPFYVMLATSSYPRYVQSGLILDNTTDYQNFLLPRPESRPDYLLTTAAGDYLAGGSLGTLAATAGDLRLYRLDAGARAAVEAQIARSQAQILARPPFPTLAAGS